MTNETFGRICFAVALLLIGSRMLGDYVIFPYIAVTKAEKGEFKEACAYVVGTKKKEILMLPLSGLMVHNIKAEKYYL